MPFTDQDFELIVDNTRDISLTTGATTGGATIPNPTAEQLRSAAQSARQYYTVMEPALARARAALESAEPYAGDVAGAAKNAEELVPMIVDLEARANRAR